MPNPPRKTKPFAVAVHPKRKQIEKAIIEGQPINSISKTFGISRDALSGYKKKVLYPKIMENSQKVAETRQSVHIATERKSITDATELFDIILTAVSRMQKMSDACDEYLRDPDDIEKYFLGPHDYEINVVGYRKDKDGKRHKVKEPLGEILARLKQNGYEVTRLTWSQADPRIMLVRASETLSRQMDTMVNAWKAIEDQRTNFSKAPEWKELTVLLEEILGRHPEERQIIADRLRSV